MTEKEQVSDYMSKLKHPLKDEIEAVRKIIKLSDKNIKERIKWNAPSYYCPEDMVTFNPKNQMAVHLVFHHPDIVKVRSPLLLGEYKDRRMMYFRDMKEIRQNKKALQARNAGAYKKDNKEKQIKTMRKLKLQVQISVDGFVGGPDGQLDWMTWNWDEKLKQYTEKLTDPITTILLGRKMADGFIQHWAKVKADPANPEHSAGIKFTDTHKVVFSKTMDSSIWPETDIAKGNLADEINKLKSEAGGDIIVYGGANFVSNLISENLIDEYYFFVNPVILGNGIQIFDKINEMQKLQSLGSTAFECGITVLHYQSIK